MSVDGLQICKCILNRLFITPTRVSPIAGLQYLLEYHTVVLFVKLYFSFEFETANQPGFEPRTLELKAATLTMELHSIKKLLTFFILNQLCINFITSIKSHAVLFCNRIRLKFVQLTSFCLRAFPH